MSPNLSSMHYPPNALLYEQVLFSLLSLVGVSSHLFSPFQRYENCYVTFIARCLMDFVVQGQ
jgi:hypothetical protein